MAQIPAGVSLASGEHGQAISMGHKQPLRLIFKAG